MKLIGVVRVGLAVAAATAAGLTFAPAANAAVTQAFDGALPCSVRADGTRACQGIVNTFDGAPIDVNLFLPAEPAAGADGDYPLIMEFHGWGGSKLSGSQRWTDNGYAYFSMSDRGWGASCGGTDSKRLTAACANGFNHLMDTRYEVRDAQEFVGKLVDDGIVDPDRVGTMGGSYGGGISMALAALKNRKMMPDGSLVPWTSPEGTPITLAAAAPDIPWTDLANSLLPNGRTLDYVEDAPYDAGPIGIMKQTFVTGLFGTGLALSNYAPPGTEEDADLIPWYSLISAGEPYDDNPLAADIVDEVTTHHSSYYIDDSVSPPPMLISNGWTDDLFPADEALRYYNRTKANHPGARISLFFSDHGHQRGQNKAADTALRRQRVQAFFDHYLLGAGPEPEVGVETIEQVCGAPSGASHTAATWKDLAPGEIRFSQADAKLISPSAGDPTVNRAYDPIGGGGACATAPAADQPGLASYRLPPAPAGGYTLMGSPTIVADILSPGPHSQIAARLIDIDPATGQGTLVARGLYRAESTGAATSGVRRVFQLHPNGYRFAEGHIAKLELMPDDFPYSRRTNGQLPVTVANLELRLPVLEQPGTAGAVEPAPKVVPAGYELAPDYASEPVDTDGDGVTDDVDACDDQPGPASNDGCPVTEPDTDGDGIPDSSDACPNEDGPVENGGCPVGVDADGDGIPDSTDQCDDQPGPESNGGCPVATVDTDGDGLSDPEDACPEEAGPESNFGCPALVEPDSDGDGIVNSQDECPARAGPASNNGCPETEPPPSANCSEKIIGTADDDVLEGTGASERIVGRDGADRITGEKGADCVAGQGAGDRINGGQGRDRVSGGRGNDRIQSRDGDKDDVSCGAGRGDVAVVDRRDDVAGCEEVRKV